MAQSLNKFLTNMLLSGIITQEEGINYMWHNPFIFFPSRPFASFYLSLQGKIPSKVIKEIFYWMGLLQGRNSTRMMKNRFGFSKDDLEGFIHGATLIGMGELNLKEYDKESFKYGNIEGERSTFALRLKEILAKSKLPVDDYLCGILAGGAEVLFDVPCYCSEKKCMAMGEDKCLYYLESDKTHPFPFLRKNLSDFDSIDREISKKYLNKKAFIKISLNKKFSFRDGEFYLNNYEGYNIEVYLVYLLDKILSENFKDAYGKALEILFKEGFDLVLQKRKFNLSNIELQKVLEKLEIIGLGKFIIKNSAKDVIFLENKNSVIASEYRNLFGKSKKSIDFLIEVYLQTLISHVFSRICKTSEVSCKAAGEQTCIFKLEYS